MESRLLSSRASDLYRYGTLAFVVIWLGFIAFVSSIRAAGDGISHIAHLGGLVAGYLLLRRDGLLPRYRRRTPWGRLWRDIQHRRRRARFERHEARRRRETLH